jgi:hypothetical protein
LALTIRATHLIVRRLTSNISIMKRVFLALAAVAIFCMPAQGQRRDEPHSAPVMIDVGPATPEHNLSFESEPAPDAAQAAVDVAIARGRRGRGPLIGGVLGAVVSTAFGVYVMSTTEDYVAPPAYLFTATAGALIGALVGAMFQ